MKRQMTNLYKNSFTWYIFSPDGRVFGKMGHSERRGPYVGVNIPGDKHQPLFESGAAYFR